MLYLEGMLIIDYFIHLRNYSKNIKPNFITCWCLLPNNTAKNQRHVDSAFSPSCGEIHACSRHLMMSPRLLPLKCPVRAKKRLLSRKPFGTACLLELDKKKTPQVREGTSSLEGRMRSFSPKCWWLQAVFLAVTTRGEWKSVLFWLMMGVSLDLWGWDRGGWDRWGEEGNVD